MLTACFVIAIINILLRIGSENKLEDYKRESGVGFVLAVLVIILFFVS